MAGVERAFGGWSDSDEEAEEDVVLRLDCDSIDGDAAADDTCVPCGGAVEASSAAGPFAHWTGADLCRAWDADLEKLKAEKLGTGRRHVVTRCTCTCGGGPCMQTRRDVLFPTSLGPRCFVCMMGTPPRCFCDCRGCTAMKVDQARSGGPAFWPEKLEGLASGRAEAPLGLLGCGFS